MKKLRNVGAGLVNARKEKGITLVSLIITIIIMLILVGVSVDVIIDGKLIDSAENTISKADEQIKTQGEQEKNTVSTWDDEPGKGVKSSTKIYCVHEWGEWNVTTANTCMQEGVKTKTCIKCGAAETATLAILGHDYASNRICTRCGYEAGVYAILYSDGDLRFNTTGMIDKAKTEAGNTVVMQSSNIISLAMTDTTQPWASNRASITTVTIEEEITPKNTRYWFSSCNKLTTINNIGNLKTADVTNMRNMFYGCSSLTTLDVTGFNTAKVTVMEEMFYNCSSLTTLDLTNWDVTKVTSMYMMFAYCSNIQSIYLGEFNAVNVTHIGGMFQSCTNLSILDTSNFSTSSKLLNMNHMFFGCRNIQTLDLSKFDTTNVSNMANVFYGCRNLTDVNLSSFETGNVTNMNLMFAVCSNLTTLNLSSFDTKKVNNMTAMFSDCYALTFLDFRQATFDAVTSYTNIFYGVKNNIKVIVKDAGEETNVPKTWIEDKLSGKGTVYTVTEWKAAGGE